MDDHSPTIGLVLSGGGARGLAHIGVLKVFEAAGIHPDKIAGTSMGGVLGGAYAAGYSAHELEHEVLKFSHIRQMMKLVDLTTPRKGLLQGVKVRAYLESLIDPGMTFDQLHIPFAVSAVDLRTAREVTLDRGPLLPALLATSAVPGIFPPVELDHFKLVDGGVLNNLPVDVMETMGVDVIIAVDVQYKPKSGTTYEELPLARAMPFPVPELFIDFFWTELIMSSRLVNYKLEHHPPDILINPPVPAEISLLAGFQRGNEAIAAGESAAREALPQILSRIRAEKPNFV